MEKINVAEKLARFDAHWQPKVVAALNGQHVKLVKFQGPFVWHSHETEDEMFFVLDGTFSFFLDGKTYLGGPGSCVRNGGVRWVAHSVRACSGGRRRSSPSPGSGPV